MKTNSTLIIAGIVLVIIVIIGAVALLGSSDKSAHPNISVSTTVGSGYTTAQSTVIPYPTTVGSSGSSTANTYNGTFVYAIKVGPSGIVVNETPSGNETIYLYNSFQSATGSFHFSMGGSQLYPYNGTGKGTGTLNLTTNGYCTGSATVPYTYNIIDAQFPGLKNMTVIFETVMPNSSAGITTGPNIINKSVTLSCVGPTNGISYTQVSNFSLLSVYPLIISVNTTGTTTANSTAAMNATGISYRATVTRS